MYRNLPSFSILLPEAPGIMDFSITITGCLELMHTNGDILTSVLIIAFDSLGLYLLQSELPR